jgi:hypothetical protein
MIIKTKDVLTRYNIKLGTLINRRKVIEEAGGFLPRKQKGSAKNHYDTDVLDELAINGDLGDDALLTMLNKDAAKEQAS